MWHRSASAYYSTARKMMAQRLSKCRSCECGIEPGDQILLLDRQFASAGGSGNGWVSVHQGCVWDRRQGVAPCLTWAQMDRIYNATRGLPAPVDPLARRFLGALVAARSERMACKLVTVREDDAGLELGPDLLEGYRQWLRFSPNVDRQDPAWRPVEANGRTPWHNRDGEKSQRERLDSAARLGRETVEGRYARAAGSGIR